MGIYQFEMKLITLLFSLLWIFNTECLHLHCKLKHMENLKDSVKVQILTHWVVEKIVA